MINRKGCEVLGYDAHELLGKNWFDTCLPDELPGVTCAFKCEQAVEVAESVTATHLYRIAQEALTNALKHARPEHILIALESDNGHPILQVADDGIGFNSSEKSEGMGLMTMQYRPSGFAPSPASPPPTLRRWGDDWPLRPVCSLAFRRSSADAGSAERFLARRLVGFPSSVHRRGIGGAVPGTHRRGGLLPAGYQRPTVSRSPRRQ